MNYCIKNNRGVYLKLDSNGTPVTCGKNVKGIFDYQKAMNIYKNLPKTMKNFHFKVEVIPDIICTEPTKTEKKNKKKPLNNCTYEVSEKISRWVEEFGSCEDVFNKADQREKELIKELKSKDNELLDILHIIEIEPSKDLFGGWKLYKQIRNNRLERRVIKDEICIIENVLKEIDNVSSFHRERVKKAIDGLIKRKYSFRIIEEET